MPSMSRATTPIVSRPVLVDYLFILAGCALSLVLIYLSPQPIMVEASEKVTSAALRDFVTSLAQPLRLSDGVILLWPLFYISTAMVGRYSGLTSGEWLWIIAWICILLLTGLDAWERWGSSSLYSMLSMENVKRIRYLWYLIFVPSLGGLALLFALISAFSKDPLPWTHTFSLALVSWPIFPLAGILSLGKFA